MRYHLCNSNNFKIAVKHLTNGDIDQGRFRLIGSGHSVYNDLLFESGRDLAIPALNFKRWVEVVFNEY